MATSRVFNPSDSPVVIDAEGHTLGGGEWAEVDDSQDPVLSLLEQGRLLPPSDSSANSAKPKE